MCRGSGVGLSVAIWEGSSWVVGEKPPAGSLQAFHWPTGSLISLLWEPKLELEGSELAFAKHWAWFSFLLPPLTYPFHRQKS